MSQSIVVIIRKDHRTGDTEVVSQYTAVKGLKLPRVFKDHAAARDYLYHHYSVPCSAINEPLNEYESNTILGAVFSTQALPVIVGG